jgi:cbb3-type cytochrome oxidase subunit 1
LTSLLAFPLALLFGVSAGYVGGRLDGAVFFLMSVVASIPFWWTRTIAGLLIIVGQGFLFYDMWMTARQPEPAYAPESVPAAA